jgi:hypothetical protein
MAGRPSLLRVTADGGARRAGPFLLTLSPDGGEGIGTQPGSVRLSQNVLHAVRPGKASMFFQQPRDFVDHGFLFRFRRVLFVIRVGAQGHAARDVFRQE